MSARRDCLGTPLRVGMSVLLAWTPAGGWLGRRVLGEVVETTLGVRDDGSPAMRLLAVRDVDDVVTIAPEICILARESISEDAFEIAVAAPAIGGRP